MLADIQLAGAIFPHLIPAATIPNGELERAAHDRDDARVDLARVPLEVRPTPLLEGVAKIVD
jgi:hypothetical protein